MIILNIPYYIPISIKKEITIPLNIARSQVYQLAERKGIAIIRNDTIYFTETDSTMYFIYNSYLYNYKETDKIKVRKKY